MSTSTRVRGAVGTAGSNPVLRVLARIGFAASGLIHLLLGYLAIQVALHHHATSDQSGAIAAIGKLPGGPFLLWAMTVGLFALALWLLLAGILDIGSASSKRWSRTLVSVAKGLAYGALAVTSLTFARGSSSNASGSTQTASADILKLPGGQILLALVGLIAIGVGGYMIAKGARRTFRKDLGMPTGTAGRVVTILGIVGYIAKGIAVAVVGILFAVAAVTVDPKKATGLDGALKSLTDLPFGAILLLAVGIGLIAFGIYTFVRARYARL